MARVQFDVVGRMEEFDELTVTLDALPREGEEVQLPHPDHGDDGLSLTVRTVVHYPFGTREDPEPFVYVVLGAPRRDR